MKKINIFLLAILSILTLFSCSDEHEPRLLGETTNPKFTSVPVEDTYILKRENIADVLHTFKWTRASWSMNIVARYTLEIALAGTNFEKFAVITSIRDTAYSMTVADLNRAVYSLRPTELTNEFEVRLVARVDAPDNAGLAQVLPASQMLNWTITHFEERIIPTNLYLVGDAFKGWPGTWADVAGQLIPVNSSEGKFWIVAYLKKGGFKFARQLDWADSFGISTDNSDAIGEYEEGEKNINVETPGHYLIFVDFKEKVISVTPPNVYLKGETAIGGWDSALADNKFTVNPDNPLELISIPFVKNGPLRMCISHPRLNDWWRAEFNIFGGKIEFRGNGGDQQAVNVTIGQKAILNFNEGTGRVIN